MQNGRIEAGILKRKCDVLKIKDHSSRQLADRYAASSYRPSPLDRVPLGPPMFAQRLFYPQVVSGSPLPSSRENRNFLRRPDGSKIIGPQPQN